MHKLSRRGILAGLLATGAAPAAAVDDTPDVPRPTFIKGMIMPRAYAAPDPHYAYASHAPAVVMYEYQIFDGKKFVPLNSAAGQDVVRELGG